MNESEMNENECIKMKWIKAKEEIKTKGVKCVNRIPN